MSTVENESLVPVADAGFGVGRRTIGRRIKNPPPGFPTVLRINGRLYFRRSELEKYRAQMLAEAGVVAKTETQANAEATAIIARAKAMARAEETVAKASAKAEAILAEARIKSASIMSRAGAKAESEQAAI
jgi:hypothetical protein